MNDPHEIIAGYLVRGRQYTTALTALGIVVIGIAH
jgi:voltage-gated potassium channel Kch